MEHVRSHISRFATQLALMSLTTMAFAQNLIPNPGFEHYTLCPSQDSQMNRATSWSSPTPTSPDYFSSCAGSNCPGWPYICVPVNWTGHQEPHGGESYAGIFTYWAPVGFNFREYIQCPLSTPLQAGVTYTVSMYVSLADTCSTGMNNIGIALTTDSINSATIYTIDAAPAVYAYEPITDKNGWTRICGSYTASGGERYCTIGNFFIDSNTTYVSGLGGMFEHSFYYIDDVSVAVADESSEWEVESDLVLCSGDTLLLTVNDPNVIWEDSITGVTFPVTESGIYHVESLIGECPLVEDFLVTAIDCPAQLTMPNVFTPDGNGTNELFVPVGQKDIGEATLEIFNRWGQLLFSTTDLSSGWDGTAHGKPCTEGVYFWKVTTSGTTQEFHGFFSLIR